MLYLALVKYQIAAFEHVLKLHHIQSPRIVSVELLKNVLDLKVTLPFCLIEEIFLWEAARITLLEPLERVMIL